jgi:putrescine transport system ATP-binding protein
VKRPRLLLLDEPLAALDKKLRQETQFELKELQARLGLTFLIVTHDQEEAMTVADRIGVMHQGHLMQVATPPEIYERPNSRWVAGFIGEINLFEGRVGASDAAGTLVESAAIGKLRVVPPIAAPSGAAVWVAVRPEKIRLSHERPAGAAGNAENSAPGEVSYIGYLGDLSVYKVRLAGGMIVKVALANVSRIAAQPIAIGDPVWLTFAPDAALVLAG